MRFSSHYSLHRRAVVATFDLSTANLHMLDTDHWLSNPRSAICLKLHSPAWAIAGVAAPDPELERPEQMRIWTAAEVVAFAKARDLPGPAATLFASSVDGADLLGVYQEVLVTEVRLTPFADAKVLRVRDAFLAGL